MTTAKPTFYFYDLETSGIRPRTNRIMQFAGQRTDMDLEPVGEPDNILVKLTDDILPEPEAVLLTGITPQQTRADGISEVEFLRYFDRDIATPNTIFVGFNTVRFDDEFMRFTMYRNFYDAYEWEWKDGRGRWDMLDLTRMVRALRPEGIKWPVDKAGKASNRLELLTEANGLMHDGAHDALSDVAATIAVARLIHNKQPKLFEYLLGKRTKEAVAELVESGQPFIYTSGKYPSVYEKTTVVARLGKHPGSQSAALVYDLRQDPALFAQLTPQQIADAMRTRPEDETKRFPVKTLKYNRCPAIAPLGVLDADSQKRLKINLEQIQKNRTALKKIPDFYKNVVAAIKILEQQRQAEAPKTEPVDARLYDGFISDGDRTLMAVVRAAESNEIAGLDVPFKDDRLKELLPLYKARNFPARLSGDEREAWEAYRRQKLMDGGRLSEAAQYFAKIDELAKQPNLAAGSQYLLEELQLYGESILPVPDEL